MIPIYQAGQADGALFIAMRYVEGTDLGQLAGHAGASLVHPPSLDAVAVSLTRSVATRINGWPSSKEGVKP